MRTVRNPSKTLSPAATRSSRSIRARSACKASRSAPSIAPSTMVYPSRAIRSTCAARAVESSMRESWAAAFVRSTKESRRLADAAQHGRLRELLRRRRRPLRGRETLPQRRDDRAGGRVALNRLGSPSSRRRLHLATRPGSFWSVAESTSPLRSGSGHIRPPGLQTTRCRRELRGASRGRAGVRSRRGARGRASSRASASSRTTRRRVGHGEARCRA